MDYFLDTPSFQASKTTAFTSSYDVWAYNGDKESEQIEHEVKQLKGVFLNNDDIKALEKTLKNGNYGKCTLYLLLDAVYDQRREMAVNMLNFKQYSADQLPEMAWIAFEDGDYDFFEKLCKLSIGVTLEKKVLNRVLHIVVGQDDCSDNYRDLVEYLITKGADPHNTSEYSGPNEERQDPLTIAKTKNPPDTELIELLSKTLPRG